MNRDALLLYLHDVRDLEVARYRLGQMFGQEENDAKRKLRELRTGEYWEEPEAALSQSGWKTALVGIISFALGWVIFLLGFYELGPLAPFVLEVIGVGLLVVGVLLFFAGLWEFFGDLKTWLRAKKELRRVRAHNGEVDATILGHRREADEVEAAWTARSRYLVDERSKADALLEHYYALNILPSQYRSLVPVCYIYEYMSTSQATLEDTLMHEHMENGFQRLERKLDQVLAAVERQIYETRCLRAENRARAKIQASRDRQMLASLQATERNTAAAAQYAELAECNTAACAYFELATYLKD